MQRQSRPGGLGRDPALRRAGKRAVRRGEHDHQQLLGVITALEALKEPCRVELWSDSKYVVDALDKGWAVKWRANGWKKLDKKPALNPDLWERLLALTEKHELHCHWVKGHAENEYNNRCDALAVAARERIVREQA